MRCARCAAAGTRLWMAPVKNFEGYIFDYGGVLVHHQEGAELARMAELAGIALEPFGELYWAKRLAYDRGDLSGPEYWASIGLTAGKMVTPAVVEALIEIDNTSWMNFDEPMWQWIEELRRAGKRVAMLSNMPSDMGEALKARTDRLQRFDQVTLSYELRSVKPDAPIYEHCLAGLGTEAAQTVFFDDRIANVHGAEMLGMQAVEFLDRDKVLARFRG